MGRRITLLVATTMIVAAALPAATSASMPQAEMDNAVLEWNVHAIDALSNPPTAPIPGAGQSPTVGLLHLAMVQGAVYDAVNAIDGGHQPYLAGIEASPRAAKRAAVATAAHDVLVGLVPELPAAIRDRLDGLYAASIATIRNGARKDAGIAVGAAAGAAMLADRANDGRFGSFSFTTGADPGEWRPTPPAFISDPFAWVARVRPFTLRRTSQFRTAGPKALTSEAYAREFTEVKEFGSASSTTRTAAQTVLALFYTDNAVLCGIARSGPSHRTRGCRS